LLTPFAIAPAPAGAAIHAAYLSPPPAISSARYRDAVKEVRRKGAASGSTRTADQTVEGIFWGYDGPRGLGVPPRLYNQVVRAFAAQHMATNSVADNARLYALVNVGMADAAIVAWSAKYAYDFWRPVVGIREHDAGFGPGNGSGAGVTSSFCDPAWAPLGRPATNKPGEFFRTPDFPAYPSGHATFGAVSLKLAALFLAQKAGVSFATAFRGTAFDFVSDEYNGVNMDPKGDARPYHRRNFTLAEAVVQNALSRVWLGVHWRFDGMGAVAPDDLAGTQIPTDPAIAHAGPDEKTIGGVPAGLTIADEVFAGSFT
jgi:vanadium chloroperoxidase